VTRSGYPQRLRGKGSPETKFISYKFTLKHHFTLEGRVPAPISSKIWKENPGFAKRCTSIRTSKGEANWFI